MVVFKGDSSVNLCGGSNCVVPVTPEMDKQQEACKDSFMSPIVLNDSTVKMNDESNSIVRAEPESNKVQHANKTSFKSYLKYYTRGGSLMNMNGGINDVLQAESDERQIPTEDPYEYPPDKNCRMNGSSSTQSSSESDPEWTLCSSCSTQSSSESDSEWSLSDHQHPKRRGSTSGPKRSRHRLVPISSEDSDDDVRKGDKRSFKSGKSTGKRRHRESDSESDFDDLLHMRRRRKRAIRIYSSTSSGSDSEKSLAHCRRIKQQVDSDNEKDPVEEEPSPLGRRRHFCYFCHNAYKRLDVHFTNKHRDQPQVAQMDLLPKNTPERKNQITVLTRLGDYTHNTTVLREKKGRIVLAKGRDVEFNEKIIEDYLPCPHCLGFLNKLYLSKHADVCANKSAINDDSNLGRSLLKRGRALVLGDDVVQDDEFKLHILARMLPNDLGKLAKTDRAIVLFGLSLFLQQGIPAAENIRYMMRTLARLLMELQKHQSGSLLSFLKPAHFDLIVQCVRNIAGSYKPGPSESMKPSFKKPSLALRLGYFLRKLAVEVRCKSLDKKDDTEMVADLTDFLTLLDTQYKKRVPYQAISEIRRKPYKTAEVLPLTQDLLHLKKVTEEKIETCTSNPERCNGDRKTWTELAKAVLARIIVFNARRSGDAAKMRLYDYNARMTYDETMISDEFKSLMSDIEVSMGRQLELVELIGKNGKPVPCLLTPPVQKAMELLYNTRRSVGISTANPYFFVRPCKDSVGFIRGSDALCSAAENCSGELLKILNIKSKNVRKYVATVGNLIEAKDRDLGWLNRHLGHSEGVHQLFYNIHTEAIEMTKVGILLSAIDGGKIGQLVKSGKKLEDITDEDLPKIITEGKPKLKRENGEVRSELFSTTDGSEDEETRLCDTRLGLSPIRVKLVQEEESALLSAELEVQAPREEATHSKWTLYLRQIVPNSDFLSPL